MFTYLVRIILRYRLINLIVIFLATLFMGYKATQVRLSYEFSKMLPESDSIAKFYSYFKEQFGEDGAVMFIGIQDEDIFELDKFRAWYKLTNSVRNVDGVAEVVSLARVYHMTKNQETRKFDFEPIVKTLPQTQAEVDSLKDIIQSYPFYSGLLYNHETFATLLMITLDKHKLNTKSRVSLIRQIQEEVDSFGSEQGIKIHYSGLPYIRTKTSEKVQDELLLFVILALAIASIILFIFFRSFKAVLFTMIIVCISVVWVMGTISLLGYEITLLTGILPPLLIIIVVENCIFLLNKYHSEYRVHGNKIKALSRVVQRIGSANFLTNATTAAGFAAFIITGNKILVEFGIVASLSIMMAYILSLFLIPIIFSFLAFPETSGPYKCGRVSQYHPQYSRLFSVG